MTKFKVGDIVRVIRPNDIPWTPFGIEWLNKCGWHGEIVTQWCTGIVTIKGISNKWDIESPYNEAKIEEKCLVLVKRRTQ